MKKTIIPILFLLLIATTSFAQTIIISTMGDADIYVGGKKVAAGSLKLKVPKNSSVRVTIAKHGYVTTSRDYVNNQNIKLQKTDYIELVKDEAFQGSSESSLANKDFDISTSKKEEDAWKTITSIVTDYIDVLETSDKSSGYLKTAWVVSKFPSGNVRTRIIIKIGRTDPLSYKIKLMSQKSDPGKASDDDYSDWDRLLKKYEGIFNEMQQRLK